MTQIADMSIDQVFEQNKAMIESNKSKIQKLKLEIVPMFYGAKLVVGGEQ